jgi:outer membrane protein
MLASTMASAASPKIGFVNMNQLLKEAPQVEAINNKLQDRFSAPKKELDDLGNSIKEQEKEIKRNELLMTESKLKKSKENLLEQIKQYREKEAKLAKELQAMQNQELAVFRDVVRKVIGEMAEQEKFDLILNDGVMYADESLNVTDKLLERLKKQAPAK